MHRRLPGARLPLPARDFLIRANKEDLKLARDMEFDETGMLTSVSDYHIYLKLGKTRQQAMDMYLDLARQALEWGIIPRCHFEDVTRADIYGFCLPFAQKLMELSQQSGMPVKIRLCDTMGYGVPYPGAALPPLGAAHRACLHRRGRCARRMAGMARPQRLPQGAGQRRHGLAQRLRRGQQHAVRLWRAHGQHAAGSPDHRVHLAHR